MKYTKFIIKNYKGIDEIVKSIENQGNYELRNMSKKISIQNIEVSVRTSKDDNDYFSLTDMAKWKNAEDPRFVVQKWMSNKFTIEFLGIWEDAFNPDFNMVEFNQFKNQLNLISGFFVLKIKIALLIMESCFYRVQIS